MTFEDDVRDGLTSSPKHLSSKYFYDDEGSRLFQQIMEVEEYYLTDAEFEVFNSLKQEILQFFSEDDSPFNLIEFGAGDGLKTKVLLRHFLASHANFTYTPIDISGKALQDLTNDLTREMPELRVNGIKNDYFTALSELATNNDRKVVLFLGSNIGNFTYDGSINFLSALRHELRSGDMIMIGFDLKKNPEKIKAAYNDSKGVTRAFNLNLLHRINKEMGANFDVGAFEHYPTYDPHTGEARSYIMSTKAQTVHIDKLNLTVEFDAWESIHTEISKKYSLREIEQLAAAAGFTVRKHLVDPQQYFADSIWQLK